MSKPNSQSQNSDRPNLEQKKKLAKELLKGLKRLDHRSAARFTWNHSRFRDMSPKDVLKANVSLADAQHVIARESGFAGWTNLVDYIQKLELDPNGPLPLFEDAVKAIIRGNAQGLTTLLEKTPGLVQTQSGRQHQSTLVHYLAANGVEDEHQITPKNAVEIANILFDNGGAAVDTPSKPGESGMTPLVALVTSSHPHQAGVQADLVHAFCRAGAKVDGIENDCLPLHLALAFRFPMAAKALHEWGARIDNLPVAAGLGQLDIVRSFLDSTQTLVSKSCCFTNPDHKPFHASVAPHPTDTLTQAFIFACMANHLEIAEALFNAGAHINEGPRQGISALHESCYQGHTEIAKWLLERGADSLQRDQYWNSTALGWAKGGGHNALVEYLLGLDDVDIFDAIELDRELIVRRLLTKNHSVANAPKGRGLALHLAAHLNRGEIVKTLLEFGADSATRNDFGMTALEIARKANSQEAIELLESESEN